MNEFNPRPIADINKNYSIDHIDKNPFNNNLTNLRWATKKEQSANRDFKRKEVRKLTTTDINDIYLRTKTETLLVIGKDYNISKSDLSKLLMYMHPEY